MNSERETKEMQARLDGRGDIDTEYYMQKARAMRAAYLADLYVDVKLSLKRHLIEFYQKFLCPKCQPGH